MTRYAKAPSIRPQGLLPACGVGLIAVAALLLAPGAASAAFIHKPLETFGAASQPIFANPEGLAVDQSSGDLLVIDQGAETLSRFHADGSPSDFSALGSNKIEGLAFGGARETQVAVDNSGGPTDGDIYLAHAARIDIFAEDGSLLGELTESSEGLFAEACGVGVDSAGAVYVGDYGGKVHKYVPAGAFPVSGDNTANFTRPEACTLAAGAGASAGSIFSDSYGSGGKLKKLDSATGAEQGEVSTGNTTVTVNPADGHVLTATGGEVKEFDASGASATLLSSFSPGGEVKGVAVDKSTGKVYVTRVGSLQIEVWSPALVVPHATTEAAGPIGPTSATLNATISAAGGPAASCEFQYTAEEAFQANLKEGHESFQGATSVGCTPSGPFTGSGTDAVSAQIANLPIATAYRFRVVAENANGANAGQALGFTTLGPAVLTTTVTNVTTNAATITGFVDPHGKPFSYHVDYGPTASYGSSVPVPDATGGDLPIGTANVTFGSKTVTGVAMSQGAFVVGQDIAGAGIKPGTTVTAVEGSTLTLSEFPTAGGSGVSLTSTTVFVSQPIAGLTPDTEYHARLVATNADATSPGPDRTFSTYPLDTGLPDGRAYEMVSPPQKVGEVLPPEPSGSLGNSCTECLPGINEITMPMQARADGNALAFEAQPLSSGLAPSANEYLAGRSGSGWAGQSITSPLASKGGSDLNSGFKAFSPDLTRGVFFQATPALSEEVPAGEGGKAFNDLYLWEAGGSSARPLVTVKPPQRPPGSTGGFELAFAAANSGGSGESAFTHLAFEANDALTPAVPGIAPPAPEAGAGKCGGFASSKCDLYEWVGGQLRLVNVLPGPGNEAAAAGAVIGSGRRLAETPSSRGAQETQAADVDHAISADGSRIFWSDASGQLYVRIDGKETIEIEDGGQFLTAAADGSKVLLNDGCLYDLQAGECEAQLSGSAAGFLGIMGASEDLSRIYFLSTEALAAGAVAESCETPNVDPGVREEKEGKVPVGWGCNLYAYDHGAVSFIAALNEQDNNFGLNSSYGSWRASRSNRTAQVSPDGRYLAFLSYGSLVGGYDNRFASGQCLGTPGQIAVSCFEVYEYDLQAGSLRCPSCNPSGQRPLGKSNLSLIGVSGIPSPFPQPENLPAGGEGRLFFESQDALTTADTNGHIQDVYEWTPDGVGSCNRAAGCIALISTGHSPVDSMFLNSTPSGHDAFLVTRQQLVARDKDDLLDIYDARVGGGIAEALNPPCLGGEACLGAGSSPPGAESPGTSTFSGPPNKKPHKHKKHRKHKSKHKAKKAHKRSAQHKTGGSK